MVKYSLVGYDGSDASRRAFQFAIDLARCAHGPTSGYAANSAREPVAARFYDRHFKVSTAAHAVVRNRLLAAAALGYVADGEPVYGITAPLANFGWLPAKPYVVFLTATSRDDKLWPETHWLALGQRLHALGYLAVLPGGSAVERERAAQYSRFDSQPAAAERRESAP